MPRSSRPQNYSSFYSKLLRAMAQSQDNITFKLECSKAIFYRNQFYSYINALEKEADRVFKKGDLDRYGEYVREANVGRGRIASVRDDKGRAYTTTELSQLRRDFLVNLVFLDRDKVDDESDIGKQLNKQLEDLGVLDIIAPGDSLDAGDALAEFMKGKDSKSAEGAD